MKLTLTTKEARILSLILRVDLDALGLSRADQPTARSIYRKLMKAQEEETRG